MISNSCPPPFGYKPTPVTVYPTPPEKNYFKNSEKINRKKKHEYDKSGKSFIHQTLFDLISGDQIRVECYDWSKKSGYPDQLRVEVFSDEFYQWFQRLAANSPSHGRHWS